MGLAGEDEEAGEAETLPSLLFVCEFSKEAEVERENALDNTWATPAVASRLLQGCKKGVSLFLSSEERKGRGGEERVACGYSSSRMRRELPYTEESARTEGIAFSSRSMP